MDMKQLRKVTGGAKMTPERIKELRALCAAATPGPWTHSEGIIYGNAAISGAVCAMFQEQEEIGAVELADAAFIAAARTALPEALDEIERLRALVPAWQPIETAPKDGTWFPALVDEEKRMVAHTKSSYIPITGFCLVDNGPGDAELCNPTHWLPWPEAQEVKK